MTNKFSRRELIQSLCGGIGAVGLSELLSEQVGSAAMLGLYTGPRLSVKAKYVICLFMTGGPSHVDLFDPKPGAGEISGTAARFGGPAHRAPDAGFKSVENRVSIHDLHATMLNQLGIDHTKLTYRYAGRDFRLTDVYGEVVKDILT